MQMRSTYDGHEREDVVLEVVAVVGDHLAVGDDEDLDEALLRHGAPHSPPPSGRVASSLLSGALLS